MLAGDTKHTKSIKNDGMRSIIVRVVLLAENTLFSIKSHKYQV